MPPALDDLLTSPDHYLHSFDGADAIFVAMDRAAHRRSIFLDDRIAPVSGAAMRVPVDVLKGAAPSRPAGNAWIFHIAHCGSTLLARALDGLDDRLVLREPLALRQAALARDMRMLGLALSMMGKRYPGTAMPVVKANVPVNFAIPAIAAAMSHVPAILLYYSVEDYLLAVLRSENHRAWARRVTGELAPFLGDLGGLSDAERAAALWLAQLRLFKAGLDALPQALALDAERFFAEPANVLGAAAELFGMAVSARRIDEIAGSSLFATYAKNPAVPFGNADRIARRDALRVALGPELASARAWLALNGPDYAALTGSFVARSLV